MKCLRPTHGALEECRKEPGKVNTMERKVGLWIDHNKAVIFSLANEGAAIKRISSELESDALSSRGMETESVAEDGTKEIPHLLIKYYDEVLSSIRGAESILIFGPGEAKLDLKRRLENLKLHGHIVGVESVEAMTDNQIVSKVRKHFLN